MIGHIDLSAVSPYIPKLQIAKPSKLVIGNLSEAFDIQQTLRLGNLSELSFSIPYDRDYLHKLKNNRNIDKVKERRLIKFIKNNYVEWYLITKVSNVMEDDKDYRRVECISLGIELSYRLLRSFETTSKNLSQVLNQILVGTNWSLGYVDASFDLKFRSFDISSATILDIIYQVSETFQSLVIWDTVNRQISFYNPDNIGTNRGLGVRYGKILKHITHEKNSDEFCTRLKVYGKNGMSVQRVNPSGSNYIEDYSFFLTGFQRDSNKKVISSAPDMSDSLAHAILDYQELITSKRSEFESLLTQKDGFQANLLTKENELNALETALAIIEDDLSIANKNGTSTADLIIQKNTRLTQIASKQGEINTVKSQIASVDTSIRNLRNMIAVENNFTSIQIEEWNNYIIEKEYSNEYLENDKDLLEAAKKEFEKFREPKIVIDISIVNFLECIEEKHNWDKLNLGDIITITHTKLGVNVQARIIELSFDYDSQEVKLTISNVKELLNDKERFLRDLYKAISTSTTVSVDKYKWDDAKASTDEISQIINNTWDSAKRTITASNNESVQIGRKGIILTDPSDPLKLVILQHGIIGLSVDGGNNWNTAIAASGIVSEEIFGSKCNTDIVNKLK